MSPTLSNLDLLARASEEEALEERERLVRAQLLGDFDLAEEAGRSARTHAHLASSVALARRALTLVARGPRSHAEFAHEATGILQDLAAHDAALKRQE